MFNKGSGNKPVCCNILNFTSNTICEYDVKFEPATVTDEYERATYVKNFFTKISRPYLYDNLKLYVSKKLHVLLLTPVCNNEVKLSLTFVEKKNVNNNWELLEFVVKQYVSIKHLAISSNAYRLIPKLILTRYEDFMCITSEFYVIKNESLRVLIDTYKKLYLDNYVQALDLSLKRFYIYQGNGILYNYDTFLKNEQLFRLKSGSKEILALPDDCYQTKLVVDTYQTPGQLMDTINSIYLSKELKENWNMQFNDVVKAKSQVLEGEKVLFGDNIQCVPVNGSWNLRKQKPFIGAQLWCWCILHTSQNTSNAHRFATTIRDMGQQNGIEVGDPVYLEIVDSQNGYISGMNSLTSDELQVFVIIVPKTKNKPDKLIKHMACIKNPVPVIIVHENNLKNNAILNNVLLKMNAIVGCPWSIDLSNYQKTAVSAQDIHFNYYDKTLATSTSAKYFNNAFRWCTRVNVVDDLVTYLEHSLVDIVKQFYLTCNNYPQQVVIYQNCNKENKNKLSDAYTALLENMDENFELCVIFVQKDTNLNFFSESVGEFKNVPLGTIIDNTILSSYCNFFLITKYSEVSVVSTTYYEVIYNSSTLSESDLHTLTYKMCHLNYEKAEISPTPAPSFYAEKVKKLILEEIYDIPTSPVVDNFIHFL